jgi:hypothetical protein
MTTFLAILLVLTPSVSEAQLGLNSSGHTGLANINTPENLGRGEKILGLLGRYSQYGTNDPRGEIVEYLITLAYGINDHIDISILLPLISIRAGESAFGKIHISNKYCILSRQRLMISSIFSLQVPVDKGKKYVRSKHLNAQFELNTRVAFNRINLYLNGGIGRLDYMIRSLGDLENRSFFLFAGGITYGPDLPFVFFLEWSGRRSLKDGDDDSYFQIGSILNIRERIIIKGSAGLGLPNKEVAETDKRAVLGISYMMNRR